MKNKNLRDLKTTLKLEEAKKKSDIPSEKLERLERLISTGNAILFTGAGFSIESKNISDGKIPKASELASSISEMISNESAEYLLSLGHTPDDISEIRNCKDLMIASDFFIKNIPEKERLIKLLKNTFSIKSVTQDQINICKITWRRIYTTNYDNTIELATAQAGKTITSLDLSDNTAKYKNETDVCLHINGKIDKATVADLDSKLKLSTSSYLSPDQFIQSSWYTQFKIDIENCSAIIFAGYSMYDIDVQKILFNNDAFKEKTFFIGREDSGILENYKQSLFGDVLNIGISGFGKLAGKISLTPKTREDKYIINSLDIYQLHDENHDIRDIEVSNLMLFGNVHNKYIDQTTKDIENEKGIKIIKRYEEKSIQDDLVTGSNIIISSDLGNGKTILMKKLMSSMTRVGFDCYFHLNNGFDFKKDIEKLSENKRRNIIFIDDYSHKINDVKYLISRGFTNIQVVMSTRHYGYEATKEQLISMDTSSFRNYNIDYLKENEIDDFIVIVDTLGAWGDKAGKSKKEKLRELDDEAKSQISLLLLSILNSDAIKKKIEEIIRNVFSSKKTKDTTFAILLADLIGIDIDRAVISKMAMSNEIYNQDFLENYGVANLFRIDRGIIKTKSSTLSRFIISNFFDAKYILNTLLEMVSCINRLEEKEKGDVYSFIIKSLLRFSIVEKLLPQRRVEINYYYEKIKEILPWLVKDPHYWVQYAMSVIPFNDYSNAQNYLRTAYSHAENRNNYHTKPIDTQQARLHLLVSLTKSGKDAFDDFEKGDILMKSIPNDIYKYRQVLIYKTVYTKIYNSFNPKQKVTFEHAVKRIILESMDAGILADGIVRANNSLIQNVREELNKIILDIQSKR